MTAGIVVVERREDGSCPALLPSGDGATVLDVLLGELAAAGVGAPVLVSTSPCAEVPQARGCPGLSGALEALADELGRAHGRVLVAAGGLVAPRDALGELLEDRRLSTAAATLAAPATAVAGVRVRRRRLLSAGSPAHAVTGPTAGSPGLVLVGEGERVAAAAASRAMAAAAAANGWAGDPVAYLLVALVRSAVPVTAVDLDGWPVGRPDTPAQAVELAGRVRGLDERARHRVRLARSARSDDGFYSTFVLRRASKPLTALALRLRLSPNQVTVASTLVGLGAAGCLATGTRGGLLAGALGLQASLVVDCVDGELARYTRRYTPLGAWLDASSDRVKEYAAYAGLAACARGDVWRLASGVLVLQTVRHMGDYAFLPAQLAREARPVALPLDAPGDGGGPRAGWSSARAVELSQASSAHRPVYWAKKVLHMPIAERWLVLSVGAGGGRAPRHVPGARRHGSARPRLHHGGALAADPHLGPP